MSHKKGTLKPMLAGGLHWGCWVLIVFFFIGLALSTINEIKKPDAPKKNLPKRISPFVEVSPPPPAKTATAPPAAKFSREPFWVSEARQSAAVLECTEGSIYLAKNTYADFRIPPGNCWTEWVVNPRGENRLFDATGPFWIDHNDRIDIEFMLQDRENEVYTLIDPNKDEVKITRIKAARFRNTGKRDVFIRVATRNKPPA